MSQDPAPVRARIGLVVPSSNRLAEPHFSAHAPAGVVVHTTRLRMTGRHRMPLAQLQPLIAEAAAMLADAGCDPVIFHCTANSMGEGVEAERRIGRTIETATGGLSTTTASATLAALRALDAKSLVLISPYVRETHQHEIDFLTEAGIEIAAERNLGLAGSEAYSSSPPDLWRETLRHMRTDAADAYFVSCANVQAIHVLDDMEVELGRPVITSNQVALWHGLRLAGIDDPVPGIGGLMGQLMAATAAAAE